ncbi:MAG: hypothetical protein HQ492_02495 [Woeseiaceae bacterium]|nr:hypothetical protein [Woeseiaceae bacterium]
MGVSVRGTGVMPIVTADLPGFICNADLNKKVVIVYQDGSTGYAQDVYVIDGTLYLEATRVDNSTRDQ